MAITLFSVVAESVRTHHFPQQTQAFSTTSRPTSAAVLEMIDASAAELAGRIRTAGITPSTITGTYPEAFAWCAECVRLGSAIRVIAAMTGQDPAVKKAWEAKLAEKWALLAERGYLALGDAPAPTAVSGGPLSHISSHSLDTGDADDMSDVIPTFRRSDSL